MLPVFKGKIWFYRHPIDFRKQMSGLVALIDSEWGQDPTDGDIYVFRSRKRKSVKLVMWQDDGFWLLQKRFEHKQFQFPSIQDSRMTLGLSQLHWLLSGLSVLKAPLPEKRPECFI